MSPRPWLAPTLLTVMTLAVFDSMRFSGPLIDAAFSQSTITAVVVALATYLLVGIPVALLTLTAVRGRLLRASGISVLIYVIARAAMQLFPDGLYPAGLGVTTIALAAWVLSLATVISAFSERHAVAALLGGTALSVAGQLLLGTWDLAWRSDLVALILTTFGLLALFLLGSFAVAAQAAGPQNSSQKFRLSQLWPFGLWLGLSLMVFANPAFLASQSGFALGWSGAFLIGTMAVGISLLSPEYAASGPTIEPVGSGWQRTIAATVGFAGGIAAAFIWDGVTSFIAVLVALLSSIPLLLDFSAPRGPAGTTAENGAPETVGAIEGGGTLESLDPARPSPVLLSAAAALIGAGIVVPVLLYQLDYDIPLPVPNFVVPVAAAAVMGLAALWAMWRNPRPTEVNEPIAAESAPVTPVSLEQLSGGSLLLLALLAGLLAPSIPSASAAASETGEAPESVRVLSWNLHYGVSAQPRVALDEVLATISEQDPDVVLLQEVSRGWVLGGGADMLTWLASGLDMEATWAPAADSQFGNVVLSKWPISQERAYRLPYGAGPQNRSFVSATIAHPLADVRVTSTHLQHRSGNADTRLEQLATLMEQVDAADNDGVSVLGADFNATPGSLEIETFTDAGWVSAVDAAGNSEQNTHPSDAPATRIDWLFSGPGLKVESAEVLPNETASDHLPLVADFTVSD